MSRIPAKSWKSPHVNPHAAQVYLNSPGYQYWISPPFHRVLNVDTAPERKYQHTVDQIKTVVHWGQRKLLLSEIEFLTLVGKDGLDGATVVYAGAAPGTHLELLASMFPMVKFVLVDPAPFNVKPSESIHLISDLFTDDLALDLKRQHGPNILFVSDIRTADPDRDSLAESEAKIKSDMEAQRHWHLMMEAKRSMFKFRLPWDKQCSEYLDGDIHLPVWGPQSTTESRLITRDGAPRAMRTYNHERYERQMHYFNSIMRVSLYNHEISAPGLDYCYDCKAETYILENYLKMFDPPESELQLKCTIGVLSQQLSRQISRRRTLSDPNPDKEERKTAIHKKQYENGTVPAHEVAQHRHAKKLCCASAP